MLALSMKCVLLSTKRSNWSLTLKAFRQLLITSDSIYQHLSASIYLEPLEYGYRLTEDRNFVPIISTKPSIPCNFPQPCNCKKCGKAKVCKCKLLEICCCQFCKCETSPRCKNPVK